MPSLVELSKRLPSIMRVKDPGVARSYGHAPHRATPGFRFVVAEGYPKLPPKPGSKRLRSGQSYVQERIRAWNAGRTAAWQQASSSFKPYEARYSRELGQRARARSRAAVDRLSVGGVAKSQLSSGRYVAASALSADQRLLLGAQLRRGAWRRNAAARRGEVHGFGLQGQKKPKRGKRKVKNDRLWGARYKGREGRARTMLERSDEFVDFSAPKRDMPKPFLFGMQQHFRRGVPQRLRQGYPINMFGAGAGVGGPGPDGGLIVAGGRGVWGEKTPGANRGLDWWMRRKLQQPFAQFHAGVHEAGHAATPSQVRRGRLRSPYRLAQMQARPLAAAREEARVDAAAVRAVRARGGRSFASGYTSAAGWQQLNRLIDKKPQWLVDRKDLRRAERQAAEFNRLRTRLGAPLSRGDRFAERYGRAQIGVQRRMFPAD